MKLYDSSSLLLHEVGIPSTCGSCRAVTVIRSISFSWL